MKNREKWKPSKFVYRHGKLIASRDPKEVGIGSRLMVDLVANYYEAYIREFARGNLIDLGCGKVPLFEAYKNYVSDIICVDWSNTKHTNAHLDFECDLTRNLPFKDEEFDTIILSDVLEHIPQPEFLWKEMSRILSKNGKILISVPFYYCIHEDPYDYFRYTGFALQHHAEAAGLKVLLLKAMGGVPEIIADILAKNLARLPKIGTLLALIVQNLTFAFIKTSFGKKLSQETSKAFPIGYFLVVEKSN